MPTRTFTVLVHKEGKLYVAECPDVGTVSQGATIEEAVANLREATGLYLEEFPIQEGRQMSVTLQERLKALGIVLPPGGTSFGAYVPVKRVGNLIYVAGQLPMKEGKLLAVGQVPSRCSVEHAKLAARQCVINALGAIAAAEDGVDLLTGVVRVGAFVSSDTAFIEQPKVANGASELLVDLFGDAGRHVRAAVGVNTLPLDAAVEIEFIFSC